jgi:hypothetical protein
MARKTPPKKPEVGAPGYDWAGRARSQIRARMQPRARQRSDARTRRRGTSKADKDRSVAWTEGDRMAADVPSVRQDSRAGHHGLGATKAHSEFTLGYAEVHAGVHREPLSSRGGAQTLNSSINGERLSSPGDTHLDIYQGPGERVGLTAESEREAILLAENLESQGAKNNVALSAIPKNREKRRKP